MYQNSNSENSLFQAVREWRRRERVGKTRKCRVGENGGGAGKSEKEAAPLSPVSSRFFSRLRAFSILRARLSRSLGQANSEN